MAEHTKTPWRVERGTDLIWGACNPDDMSTYGMGYAIVCGTTSSYTGGKPSIDEREANADFIVKACNSHNALVKALDGMVEMYADMVNSGDCGFWNPEEVKEVIASRAALSLASQSRAPESDAQSLETREVQS